MVKLYFVRHGETLANLEGILTGTLETDLSSAGIKSAKALGLKLKEDFDYYYCSPLRRTHQTLFAMKGENTIFTIDNRLIEVYSGLWQGKYKNELPSEEYDLYKRGLLNPPEGESLLDVDKRIIAFLNDIFNKYHADERILVVTHNGFLRSLKRLFIDRDKVNEPKNLEIFEVDESMYSKIANKY